MNEEQKGKIKDAAKVVVNDTAEWLKAEAKASTGIMRWVYGIGFIITLGIAAVLAMGCHSVPQVTAEQVQAIHGVYHAVSDEPCIFVVESVKK